MISIISTELLSFQILQISNIIFQQKNELNTPIYNICFCVWFKSQLNKFVFDSAICLANFFWDKNSMIIQTMFFFVKVKEIRTNTTMRWWWFSNTAGTFGTCIQIQWGRRGARLRFSLLFCLALGFYLERLVRNCVEMLDIRFVQPLLFDFVLYFCFQYAWHTHICIVVVYSGDKLRKKKKSQMHFCFIFLWVDGWYLDVENSIYDIYLLFQINYKKMLNFRKVENNLCDR